jgi:hypothetical protein
MSRRFAGVARGANPGRQVEERRTALPRRHRAAHRRHKPDRPLRLTPVVGVPLLLVARAHGQNLVDRGPRRLALDHRLTGNSPSPDRAAADKPFAFLGQCLMTWFAEFDCGDLLGTHKPARVKTGRNGMAIGATITVPRRATATVATPTVAAATVAAATVAAATVATPTVAAATVAAATTAPPVDPPAAPDADNVRANEGDPNTW